MARNKPIPRSQRIEFNRGTKISRNSPAVKDDVKNLSVGIMDMDSSIMYYFNEVIKPEVMVNDEKVKVPCIYASPERWTQVSKQGYLRDKKRQIITPLIVFKRTGMERNEDIPIDKLDANKPRNFYSFQKKYSQLNRYDKFSVQQNISKDKNQSYVGSKMKILVEKISDNNELIGRSYNFAPEIDGTVILSVKDKIDLKNYIGKFVEANISFADEYDLYGETIKIL